MSQNTKTNPNQLLARFRREGVFLWEQNGQLCYKAPKGRLKDNDLQALKDNKTDILDLLQAESKPVTVTPDPESRFEPFPLTDIQSAYLLGRHNLFGYGGLSCHIYLELNYPELDPKRTEAVWNRLILRHDMLRTTIDQKGCQRVRQSVPQLKVAYTDTSGWEEQKAEAKLAEIREEMGHRLYNTDHWPLFDIGVTKAHKRAVLHFSMDFLIADWASIWLLLSEFEALYEEPGRQLPDLDLSFRDYLLAESRLRETATYSRDKDYWLRRVDTLPSAPDLPLAGQQDNSGTARFRRRFLQLDNHTWEGLKQRAQKLGLTPTAVVMTAYAAVIKRWSRNEKFCLNLTLLNRLPLHAQVNDIVGDFTSVNLLAVDWCEEYSFSEQARTLQKQLFEDLDHRLFSGVEVLREIARRRGREAALMPVVFTSAIGLVEPTAGNQRKGKVNGHGISQTPQVVIDCQAMDGLAGLQVNWDVREGVFPDRMVDDMFDAFDELLRSLARTDQIWDTNEAVALPAWQLTERQQINAVKAPLPDQQLHRQVLAQATATPDLPAVFDSEGHVTYRELAQRAAAVAEKLKELGCVTQDRVAIVMDKCVHQVAAVLGTLLVGAVYVPIDTKQPELRRLAMLEQASVRFVLTCSITPMQWPDKLKIIEADKLKPYRGNITIAGGNPDLPAYIIYTSGSTGQPKGVVISHRAAANTIADINRRFNINRGDRVLGLAQLSFDLSVYDIFGPLSVGGALVYPNAGRLTDPSHWAELMAQQEVTVWNSVPALMQMLVAYLNSEQKITLPQLRLALLSGDWIPLTLPDMLVRRLPAVQVISLGGATEASIWSIYHIYKGLKADWRSIPYGRPLANQEFRVLDAQLRACPVWVAGELYITGCGLAEGYWGDNKITQERFFLHPVDGQRLYRTGDLGRYTPGGEIEFLGREDNQVKIKGHRIELGEIEATLLKHPAVAAAGVVVDGSGDDKALFAVVETAHRKERNPDEQKTEFDRLVNGIDEQADVEAAGLSREEVDLAAANLEKAVLHSMLQALLKAGLFADDNDEKHSEKHSHSMEEILKKDEIVPAFHWLVRRWLAMLTEAGLLLEHPPQHFSCPRKPDGKEVNEYWQAAEASWVAKISSTGFIAYVRSNAEKLPQLLNGQQDPVSLLFPEGRFDHVRALYFDHVMANYLNHCICTLLKRIAGNHSGKPLRILEIGAGTGATTERVLKSLEGFNVDYLFTDVTAFFIPGAKSSLGQFPGIRFGIFDVDEDYRTQGLAPNSFDIVLAAGVLENARDIPASMNRLKELICPGGWLVFTEPTKEHAWILASQAFMMTEPGDGLRVDISYLDRDGWMRLLKEYGDEPVLSLPAANHKLSSLGVHLFAKRFKEDWLPVSVPELTDFLALRLPSHMLPSQLQIADALPLTGNGKLDRHELAKWRPKPIIENSAIEMDEKSSDLLEAQLAKLWAEALGIPGIGRLQSFYDHGADSLIMAQVAGKLREKCAADPSPREIPYDALLRQMLNYPTVAALAEFIRFYSQAAGRTPDALLPELRSTSGNAVVTAYGGGGTGPLRVVFHAGLGTMNSFHLLLEHFKLHNIGPVIGITVADPETYCEFEPSGLIEQIADDYARCLWASGHTQMQLIGYSLGGFIAVEVARRLVEQGLHVSDLVLIDSHPVLFDVDDDLVIELLFIPNLHITLEQAGFGGVDSADLVRGLLHIFESNNKSVPKGSSCTIGGDEGLDKVGKLFRRLASLSMRERFKAYSDAVAKITGEQMPVEMAEGLYKVYRQSFKAARFTPPPYMGNIRFLLALEPFSILPDTAEMTLDFWREVCLDEFEVTEIRGNHLSCIEEEPNATNLAKLISAPLIKN
ncbi:MAG TPA: non-ribosomal peptide synthetase [Methylomusa anaerophila]|uniref:Phenyloxazoline synthase MbtB n=1 Tax=Methylomusa anaerophila TaxID=1930071 RepID=A0A348AM45_9FIRM|nr:non-ribosomal peptide synthetase [Methylomusa anaerophila]BBB92143.1 phenyloxazoline synthase MbtB [Methylomusa anaerophila]HML87843.1 non-ribosomal peptide synthetase [Methylomusa anaerophila]